MEKKEFIIRWLNSNTGLNTQSIYDFAKKVDNLYKASEPTKEDTPLLPTRKVCFFKLKDGKYLTENNIEITIEMLVKYPHQITDDWSFILLD